MVSICTYPLILLKNTGTFSIIDQVKYWFISLAFCTSLCNNAIAQPASCVHGSGFRFLMDAYMGSIGACNCRKATVYLNDLSLCSSDTYELTFQEEFNDSINGLVWEGFPNAPGALLTSQTMDYNTMDNVIPSEGTGKFMTRREKRTARAFRHSPDSMILQDGLPNLRTYDYTGAGIYSRRTFLYGIYEIKCRLPEENSYWPAFWLFGGKYWNEIDVFDTYEGPGSFISSIGHDFFGDKDVSGCNDTYKDIDMREWHIYRCIYEYDRIAILIDDNLIRLSPRIMTLDGRPVYCGDEFEPGAYFVNKAFPIEPMHLIVGMGVISKNGPGGSEAADENTPFPGTFEVDYVRVWEKKGGDIKLMHWPNPALTTVNFKSDHNITGIVVNDIFGRTVLTHETLGETLSLNIEALHSGVYFVNVMFANSVKSIKLIKFTQ
jgi:hypothetical protein